jgi:hypothetical protein
MIETSPMRNPQERRAEENMISYVIDAFKGLEPEN